MNLTKEVEDLYPENHQTLMKEIEDDGTYHTHELEEWMLSKCPYYPKQFIDSMQFLPKY